MTEAIKLAIAAGLMSAAAFAVWAAAKIGLAKLKARAAKTETTLDDEALEDIERALDELKPGDSK